MLPLPAAGAGATGDTTMSSTQLIEQCATRLRGIVEALDNIHDNTPHRWSTDLDDVHSSAESLLAMINDQASNQAALAQPSPAEDMSAAQELAGVKAILNDMADALKRLTFHARTTGGTAGPDAALMNACERAERVLSLGGMGAAFMRGCDDHEAKSEQAEAERAACERWITDQKLCQGSDISLFRLERNGELVSLHALLCEAYQAGQVRAALAHAPTSSASPSCKWTESSGIWETGCGQTWSFIEDGPAENGALFCHHCGGRLVLIKSDDQEDDGHGAMGDRDE